MLQSGLGLPVRLSRLRSFRLGLRGLFSLRLRSRALGSRWFRLRGRMCRNRHRPHSFRMAGQLLTQLLCMSARALSLLPRLFTGRFQLGILLPQCRHLPLAGKQTGLVAEDLRTGSCQLAVQLFQLGTHRFGRLCRSLCRGRLGTALPRTIVLLPALRHGVPPIHPLRLYALSPCFYLRLFSMAIS